MLDAFHLTPDEWQTAVRMGGRNAWMNNDHQLPNGIEHSGKMFGTVEAGYKFAKYQQYPQQNREFLLACLNMAHTALGIRRAEAALRAALKVSECWDETRYGVMLTLNRQKYLRNLGLGARLLATDKRPIVEVTRKIDAHGHLWGDDYWGVCVGEDGDVTQAKGCNAMGRIAMQIRNELREIDALKPFDG